MSKRLIFAAVATSATILPTPYTTAGESFTACTDEDVILNRDTGTYERLSARGSTEDEALDNLCEAFKELAKGTVVRSATLDGKRFLKQEDGAWHEISRYVSEANLLATDSALG